MSDLVEQLRAVIQLRGNATPLSTMIPICQAAADEIERLRAQLEAARSNSICESPRSKNTCASR
jgi:hypothetical protein